MFFSPRATLLRCLPVLLSGIALLACSSADAPAVDDAEEDALRAGVGRVSMLATSPDDHTCVIMATDKSVKCWGKNQRGELGLGDEAWRGAQPGTMGANLPRVDLGTGHSAVAVVTGYEHTCALLDDATVKCWGDNTYAQLGLERHHFYPVGGRPGDMGTHLPSVDLGKGRTTKVIAAHGNHTCAILDDDTLKCWGDNKYGQLGLGDTLARGDENGRMGDALPVVDLGAGRHAVKLALGDVHSCALLDDASIKCWGTSRAGELGIDVASRGTRPGEMGDKLARVSLGTSRTAKDVFSSDHHSCALLDDDTLKCWGGNEHGQLGQGDTKSRGRGATMGDHLAAIDLGANVKVKTAGLGQASTCAVTIDGALKCWGINLHGGLGVGDVRERGVAPGEMGNALPAVSLGNGIRAAHVTAGLFHTCVQSSGGLVKCWGLGSLGLDSYESVGDGAGEMGNALPYVDVGK